MNRGVLASVAREALALSILRAGGAKPSHTLDGIRKEAAA